MDYQYLKTNIENNFLFVTINKEKSLNTLNFDLIIELHKVLDQANEDSLIKAIFLDSVGDKAFCAGGDIKELYNANLKQDYSKAEQFFVQEYNLDYKIHKFTKPIIVWAAGITMGGGMGLVNGCSHRIVCENSIMAMPEISIGLYPDVGASYFLNNCPTNLGTFVGLTGSLCSASESIHLGFGDFFINLDLKHQLIEELLALPTENISKQNITETLIKLQNQNTISMGTNMLIENKTQIDYILKDLEINNIYSRFEEVSNSQPFISKAYKKLTGGSPTSAHLIIDQLQRSKNKPLEEVFKSELILTINCNRNHDFMEGIRALIIDKDKAPKWKFKNVGECPKEYINSHFEATGETKSLINQLQL